jgi:hypothetical protein
MVNAYSSGCIEDVKFDRKYSSVGRDNKPKIATNDELIQFIKTGLWACSFYNPRGDMYLGKRLRKNYHTTLGHSARNDVDEQLRKERKENSDILKRIQKYSLPLIK